jgi:hypothetical protein
VAVGRETLRRLRVCHNPQGWNTTSTWRISWVPYLLVRTPTVSALGASGFWCGGPWRRSRGRVRQRWLECLVDARAGHPDYRRVRVAARRSALVPRDQGIQAHTDLRSCLCVAREHPATWGYSRVTRRQGFSRRGLVGYAPAGDGAAVDDRFQCRTLCHRTCIAAPTFRSLMRGEM